VECLACVIARAVGVLLAGIFVLLLVTCIFEDDALLVLSLWVGHIHVFCFPHWC